MSSSPCSFTTALDESFALMVSLPVISCSTSTSLLFSRVGNLFLTQGFDPSGGKEGALTKPGVALDPVVLSQCLGVVQYWDIFNNDRHTPVFDDGGPPKF